METWELTDLPEERTSIECKWVYLKKTDKNRIITKFKAQLVTQGFSQKPEIDYSNNRTFVPVMRFNTLWTVLALTAINEWNLQQFNIKGAYLNSYIEEEIYMWQPPGFKNRTAQVFKLKWSLYGLKQAGNVWNKELDYALQGLRFQKLWSDSYCYSIYRRMEIISRYFWYRLMISCQPLTVRYTMTLLRNKLQSNSKSSHLESQLYYMACT